MEAFVTAITNLLNLSKRASKAITAALAAGFAYYTAPEVVADATVSGGEWIALVATALGVGVITYFSPKNADATDQDTGS